MYKQFYECTGNNLLITEMKNKPVIATIKYIMVILQYMIRIYVVVLYKITYKLP